MSVPLTTTYDNQAVADRFSSKQESRGNRRSENLVSPSGIRVVRNGTLMRASHSRPVLPKLAGVALTRRRPSDTLPLETCGVGRS
jgi:hypothetical protein